MAAPTYSVQSGPVALSASATKSLILINPAVVGFRAIELSVSFDSASAGTAVRVDVYRTTTLGSPAGTTGVLVKENAPLDTAAQSTALTALSVEPTAVEVLRSFYLTPAGGLVILQFPLGREPAAAGAGQRIGLRCVTPAAVSPNGLAVVVFEE